MPVPNCQLSISNQPRCLLSVEPPLMPSISRKVLATPVPTDASFAAPPGLGAAIVSGAIAAPVERSKPKLPAGSNVPPAFSMLVVRPMRS